MWWTLLYKTGLIVVLLIVFTSMLRLGKLLERVDTDDQGTVGIAWIQELLFFLIVVYLLVK